MTAANLSKFIELAFQYGPFFFSIWFLIGVSRWAYKNYHQAKPAEVTTLRNVFVVSFFVGTALVIASVVWWFIYRPRTYVYQGEIDDLEQYDNLESDHVYFRLVTHWSPNFPNPPKTAYFTIIESDPFKKGQQYNVNLYKGQTIVERNPLIIEVDPSDKQPVFTAECCNQEGTYYLRHAAPSKQQTNLLTQVAYADTANWQAEQGRQIKKKSSVTSVKTVPINASLLQDRTADIGEKVQTLRQLAQLDNQALAKTMDQLTGNELLVLTLLDFTRHSDRQVAFRAKQVLQKLNVDDYIATHLAAEHSPNDRVTWESVLFRITKTEAQTVVSLATQKGWVARSNLVAEIDSGRKTRLLVPTWTPSGEMYYVKAMWNPSDQRVQKCLTNLFHEELFSSKARQTLEQEDQWMRQKNGVRYVYWDEQWALHIADKIAECGGTFAFVRPGE